jgi:hypothetical protein
MQTQKTVKTLLNRLAHAAGTRHADQVKRRLLADLERLRAEGASFDDLHAWLERQAATL